MTISAAYGRPLAEIAAGERGEQVVIFVSAGCTNQEECVGARGARLQPSGDGFIVALADKTRGGSSRTRSRERERHAYEPDDL